MRTEKEFLSDKFRLAGEGTCSALAAFRMIEGATHTQELDLSIATVLSLFGEAKNNRMCAVALNESTMPELDESNELRLNAEYVSVKAPDDYTLTSEYPLIVDGGVTKTPVMLNDDFVYLTSANVCRHLLRILKIDRMSRGFLRDSIIASACGDLKDELKVTLLYRQGTNGVKKAVGCFTVPLPETLRFDDVIRGLQHMNAAAEYKYEIDKWSMNHRGFSVKLSNYVDESVLVSWSDTGFLQPQVKRGNEVIRVHGDTICDVLASLAERSDGMYEEELMSA